MVLIYLSRRQVFQLSIYHCWWYTVTCRATCWVALPEFNDSWFYYVATPMRGPGNIFFTELLLIFYKIFFKFITASIICFVVNSMRLTYLSGPCLKNIHHFFPHRFLLQFPLFLPAFPVLSRKIKGKHVDFLLIPFLSCFHNL